MLVFFFLKQGYFIWWVGFVHLFSCRLKKINHFCLLFLVTMKNEFSMFPMKSGFLLHSLFFFIITTVKICQKWTEKTYQTQVACATSKYRR